MLTALLVVLAATEADTPAWLVPFGGAGAGAFAIMAAGFMTNRLYTGSDFRRVIAERNESQQRERDMLERERETQDYLRREVVPLLAGSKDAMIAATRLVEKMAARSER